MSYSAISHSPCHSLNVFAIPGDDVCPQHVLRTLRYHQPLSPGATAALPMANWASRAAGPAVTRSPSSPAPMGDLLSLPRRSRAPAPPAGSGRQTVIGLVLACG